MIPAAPISGRPRVLVTRAIFAEVLARLQAVFDIDANRGDEPLAPAALRERLAGCDGALVMPGDRIDAALLDACPRLRVVANMAVGHDHIDVDACTARGVLATNTPDVLTEATADFGFALMLAAARRLGEAERYLRAGRWQRWSVDLLLGGEVHGKTLGLLGMGRIGQAIARRGALGFGMRVLYHARHPLPADAAAAVGGRFVDKATLLAESDHLVLVLPYSAATHHAIGAPELAQMKPTATLTNLARGGIVDDAALTEALRDGRIAAAALDVFEGEPALHPALLALPNAVLTPHIGSATRATRLAMAALAADNLLAALGGRMPPTPLNPQVLAPPRRPA